MKKIAILFSLAAAGFLFAMVFGVWARSLTTLSESVHFSVNFPVSAGTFSPGDNSSSGATEDCHDAGSPQQEFASAGSEQNNPASGGEQENPASDTEQENPTSDTEQENPASDGEQKNPVSNARWGKPSVGGVTGKTQGYVLIDLGQESWLKRLIQPRYISLGTHALRNVGTKPYKVHLEMNLCDLEPEWETSEGAWDPATQSTTRYINPGTTLGMGWYLDIPPEVMQQAVICRGQLKVMDAEAGDLLTVLPINIFNSRIN